MLTYRQIKITKSDIREVKFGSAVTVVEPCNLYECKIGDNSLIGPFVEIQKKVVIGKNCEIQSHTFICELVNIGDHCVIANGVAFINDDFSRGGPAKGNKNLWKSTSIGNHVRIGSNATILPVKICDSCIIGAGSVVTKDISEKGIYAGNPARKLRKL